MQQQLRLFVDVLHRLVRVKERVVELQVVAQIAQEVVGLHVVRHTVDGIPEALGAVVAVSTVDRHDDDEHQRYARQRGRYREQLEPETKLAKPYALHQHHWNDQEDRVALVFAGNRRHVQQQRRIDQIAPLSQVLGSHQNDRQAGQRPNHRRGIGRCADGAQVPFERRERDQDANAKRQAQDQFDRPAVPRWPNTLPQRHPVAALPDQKVDQHDGQVEVQEQGDRLAKMLPTQVGDVVLFQMDEIQLETKRPKDVVEADVGKSDERGREHEQPAILQQKEDADDQRVLRQIHGPQVRPQHFVRGVDGNHRQYCGGARQRAEGGADVAGVRRRRRAGFAQAITSAASAYQVSMYGYFFSVRAERGGRRFKLLAIQLRVSAGSMTSSKPPPTPALIALAPS